MPFLMSKLEFGRFVFLKHNEINITIAVANCLPIKVRFIYPANAMLILKKKKSKEQLTQVTKHISTLSSINRMYEWDFSALFSRMTSLWWPKGDKYLFGNTPDLTVCYYLLINSRHPTFILLKLQLQPQRRQLSSSTFSHRAQNPCCVICRSLTLLFWTKKNGTLSRITSRMLLNTIHIFKKPLPQMVFFFDKRSLLILSSVFE